MHPSSFKICIIGSGNVAHFMGKKLLHSQHQVVQIISPNIEHARKLAEVLNCDYADIITNINPIVDVVILAINDDSIKKIAPNDLLKTKIVGFFPF